MFSEAAGGGACLCVKGYGWSFQVTGGELGALGNPSGPALNAPMIVS